MFFLSYKRNTGQRSTAQHTTNAAQHSTSAQQKSVIQTDRETFLYIPLLELYVLSTLPDMIQNFNSLLTSHDSPLILY